MRARKRGTATGVVQFCLCRHFRRRKHGISIHRRNFAPLAFAALRLWRNHIGLLLWLMAVGSRAWGEGEDGAGLSLKYADRPILLARESRVPSRTLPLLLCSRKTFLPSLVTSLRPFLPSRILWRARAHTHTPWLRFIAARAREIAWRIRSLALDFSSPPPLYLGANFQFAPRIPDFRVMARAGKRRLLRNSRESLR